ncbi:MAG: glycosyl transferase family 2 [Verrucomicrobia bacterium]|nr:MAG: glycosyl transferase family 2 [Verrucomicrobiota bacterium]
MTVPLSRHITSSLKPPAIRVLPVDNCRPLWSVMIPTYNPRPDYLEETLHSVLQQDPGPEQMQIEVIDDRSTDDVAAQTIRRVGGGRVSFHAELQNRGLANTWNRCIERARGHWVHILHQDDIVLPGFYTQLRKGAEDSDAGAIFCRYASTNSKGHWMGISELHRESAGLLDDWHARITVQQLIQCPAIAVRRFVYEQLGGFLPRLRYTADWEMWQRVASQFSFWFEPSILACYRVHSDSATSRLRRDAADVREVREVIDLTTAYHSPDRGRVLAGKARSFYAELAVFYAREILVETGFPSAWKQIVEALRLCRSRRVIWQISSFLVLWFRIIGSRLKRRIKSKANAPGRS